MFALDIVFPFSTEFLSELDVVCPSQHSVAFETLHRRAFSDLSALFIVPHRVPGGGELTAKIFDKNGIEVPLEEYHLDIEQIKQASFPELEGVKLILQSWGF